MKWQMRKPNFRRTTFLAKSKHIRLGYRLNFRLIQSIVVWRFSFAFPFQVGTSVPFVNNLKDVFEWRLKKD